MSGLILRVLLMLVALGFVAAVLQLGLHFYKQVKQLKQGEKNEKNNSTTNAV
jgi:hypothetical protein